MSGAPTPGEPDGTRPAGGASERAPLGKAARGAASRQDFHAEDVLDKPFDRDLTLRLCRYVRPYARHIVLSVVLILLSTLLQLLGPLLLKEAIDGPLAGAPPAAAPDVCAAPLAAWLGELLGGEPDGQGPAPAAAGTDLRLRVLAGVLAIYFALLLLAFLARYAQTIAMNFIGQSVMRDLRMHLFEHLQRQSLTFFQRQPVGRLVTRVTSDVEALNELFTSGLVTFFGDLLTVFGIVALMFYYNPKLAALALATSPFLIGITLVFRAKARKHYREIRRTLAHLNAFTQESISGMEIIQISRREDARAEQYAAINSRYMDAYLKSIFWYAIFFPAVEVLSAISLALVVAHGGSDILLGVTTFGEFFLFWNYLNKFFVPIRDLAEKYNILQAAMAAAERVFGIIDHDSALPEPAAARAVAPLAKEIRFENAWFAYDGANHVLREVDFAVRRGETVALVGATGAGKSTIVNLLLRFHDPTRGRVTIDGADLRSFESAAHRRRFGLVLQDVSIFSRTVEENIDLDRGLAESELRGAAERVRADRVVSRLGGGYAEKMKERGRTLSSGERQLLAFARALAGDPEIVVLDEATSHIDTDTERLIQEALETLTRGRTTVVIAHRLSTIRHADRILVFHRGELRETGNHEELMARGGIYARLHRLQFGLTDAGAAGHAPATNDAPP
ncbi:MAG: ABC transporter ATP-binding protein/permease [Planctomycetes bacterium]|nr:ABC transporter ATP-binding protein/permease [Planctomycetota bacterium]